MSEVGCRTFPPPHLAPASRRAPWTFGHETDAESGAEFRALTSDFRAPSSCVLWSLRLHKALIGRCSGAVILAVAGAGLCRADVEMPADVGETLGVVEARLGPPMSYFGIGDRLVYYYEAGRIEFTNAVVAAMEWRSPEALEEEARRREEVAALRRQRERDEAERRIKEGLEVLETTLQDPDFQASSAARRVAFWRRFRDQYPDIPAAREYQSALFELAREERTAAEEARAAAEREDLGREVELARMDALRAEGEAARARELAAQVEREAARNRLLLPPEPVWTAPDREPVVVWETVYFGGGGVRRPRDAETVEPRPAPRSRYGVESRLGPQGTPVFGVRP